MKAGVLAKLILSRATWSTRAAFILARTDLASRDHLQRQRKRAAAVVYRFGTTIAWTTWREVTRRGHRLAGARASKMVSFTSLGMTSSKTVSNETSIGYPFIINSHLIDSEQLMVKVKFFRIHRRSQRGNS